jgi:hypothetical protein
MALTILTYGVDPEPRWTLGNELELRPLPSGRYLAPATWRPLRVAALGAG